MAGLSDSLVRIVNQSGAYRRRSGNTRLIVDGRELFLTVLVVSRRADLKIGYITPYYVVLRRVIVFRVIA